MDEDTLPEMPHKDDVMEMARLQAEADGEPLVNLLRKASVSGWKDMPKLWAYLMKLQEDEANAKKAGAVLETQDIFEQLLERIHRTIRNRMCHSLGHHSINHIHIQWHHQWHIKHPTSSYLQHSIMRHSQDHQ